MANQFKKALAVALVAATTISGITPVSQLIIPASISLAAETDKIVVDSALGATLAVAKGTTTTVNLPKEENEVINGVSTKVTYTVATSDKSIVGLKAKGDASVSAETVLTYAGTELQFEGLKGGKATVTITKKTADSVIGTQTVEVTVVEKAGLTVAASGVISGSGIANDAAVAADSTIKVYKGEAVKIAATTTTAAGQIDTEKDFTTVVADSSVASVVTENKTDKVGIITPTTVSKEAVSGQTYTVFFTANKVGSTLVTIGQAAAKDSSTSATSVTFKIEVIERDGELSADYDYDRDGKAETYTANYYDGAKFITKADAKEKAVALDLKSNKSIQLSAKSGNGQAISFASTDPSVATVSNTGLVTAIKKGSTTIKISTAASGTSNLKASEIDVVVNVTENEVAYLTVTGDATASSVGTFNGTNVPDITVGSVVADDAAAYTIINSDSDNKAIVLSTKDKKTANIRITSNAGDYIESVSSDTGIFTFNASTGTLTAVKAGKGTLTIQTKPNTVVENSSKIIINVYVTDLNVDNTIDAKAAKVDAVNKTATINAKATYGDVVFDGKIYKLDTATGKYDNGSASVDGVSVDAKGVVTFVPAGKSGTVYAKATVANSKDALGAKDTFVAIDYTNAAENVITIEGATKDVVEVVAGSTATINVKATDAKTAFVVTSSDEEVATATYADGVITVNGVSAGATMLLIKGIAGTDGYSDPAPTSVVIKVSKKAAAANPLKVKAKKVTIKAATLKKKNQALAVSKVMTVSGAKTKVTYTKASGNKNITIAKSTGKVTVKKGLKKGSYKVKFTVKAAKSADYKSASKTVTVTFTVK